MTAQHRRLAKREQERMRRRVEEEARGPRPLPDPLETALLVLFGGLIVLGLIVATLWFS